MIDVDIDMLTADFYVLETTSKKGTEFADLFSKSFSQSLATRDPLEKLLIPVRETHRTFSTPLLHPPHGYTHLSKR